MFDFYPYDLSMCVLDLRLWWRGLVALLIRHMGK